jgi:methyl-accepting chemotaxis protein
MDNNGGLPTTITDKDRKDIQNALREMSDSMTRVSAEKDLQKDIAQKILDEIGVPKREFNKLAKIYHASNLMEEAARNEEFMEFAEAVMAPFERQIEHQEDNYG